MRLHIAHADPEIKAAMQSKLVEISAVEAEDGVYELSLEQYTEICNHFNHNCVQMAPRHPSSVETRLCPGWAEV